MDRKRFLVFGPRTGKNILKGKKIRKLKDGGDMFEDYWTEDESSISISDTNSAQNLHVPLSNKTVMPRTSKTETVRKSFRIRTSTPIAVHKKSVLLDSKKLFPKEDVLSRAADANDGINNSDSLSRNMSLRRSPRLTRRSMRKSVTFSVMNKCYEESGDLSEIPHREGNSVSHNSLRKSERKNATSSVMYEHNEKSGNISEIPHGEGDSVSHNSLRYSLRLPERRSATFSVMNERNEESGDLSESLHRKGKKKGCLGCLQDCNVKTKAANAGIKNHKIISKSLSLTNKKLLVKPGSKQKRRTDDFNHISTNTDISHHKQATTSDRYSLRDKPVVVFEGSFTSRRTLHYQKPKKLPRKSVKKITINLTENDSESFFKKKKAEEASKVDNDDVMEIADENQRNLTTSANSTKKKSLAQKSSIFKRKQESFYNSSPKSTDKDISNNSKKKKTRKSFSNTKKLSLKNDHEITRRKTRSFYKSILNAKSVNTGNTKTTSQNTNFSSSPKSAPRSLKIARKLFNFCEGNDGNIKENDANFQKNTTYKRSSAAKSKDPAIQSSPKKAEVIQEIITFSKVSPSKTVEKKKTSVDQCKTILNGDSINSGDFVDDAEAYEANSTGKVQSSKKYCKSKKSSKKSCDENIQQCSLRLATSPKQITSLNNSVLHNEINLNSSGQAVINDEENCAADVNTPTKKSNRLDKHNEKNLETAHMDNESGNYPNSAKHDEVMDKTEKSETTIYTKNNKTSKLISLETRSARIKKVFNSSQQSDLNDEEIHEADADSPTKSTKRPSKINDKSDDHLENGCEQKISEKTKALEEITSRSMDIPNEGNLNSFVRDNNNIIETVENSQSESIDKQSSPTSESPKSAQQRQHTSNQTESLQKMPFNTIDMPLSAKKKRSKKSKPKGISNGLNQRRSNRQRQSNINDKSDDHLENGCEQKISEKTKALEEITSRSMDIPNEGNLNSFVRDNNNIIETVENSQSESIDKQSSPTSESPKSAQQRQHTSNQTESLQKMPVNTIDMPLSAKKKRSKKSKQQDISNGLNQRRSNRQRYAPLDHWRNERILYSFHDGKPVIHGIEKGVEYDDTAVKSILRRKEKYVEERKSTKKCKTSTFHPNKKKKVPVKVVKYLDIPWIMPPEATDEDYDYKIKKVFENEMRCFAFLKIKPGKMKPFQVLPNDDLLFSVFAGNVEITFGGKSFDLKHKDCVIVPRKTAYSIKNPGTISAFVQTLVGDYFELIKSRRVNRHLC